MDEDTPQVAVDRSVDGENIPYAVSTLGNVRVLLYKSRIEEGVSVQIETEAPVPHLRVMLNDADLHEGPVD